MHQQIRQMEVIQLQRQTPLRPTAHQIQITPTQTAHQIRPQEAIQQTQQPRTKQLIICGHMGSKE